MDDICKNAIHFFFFSIKFNGPERAVTASHMKFDISHLKFYLIFSAKIGYLPIILEYSVEILQKSLLLDFSHAPLYNHSSINDLTPKEVAHKMKRSIKWITETGLLLALLIVLQWCTKPLGQLVTGSCVNAVLAVSALIAGAGSGVVIALLSPVFAYVLGIAPNLAAVPAIMAGNTIFVLLLATIYGRHPWRQIAALLAAAAAKFVTLYVLVVTLICGVASDALLEQGILKAPMLKALPAAFTWPQLATALMGGALALILVPILKKALPNR